MADNKQFQQMYDVGWDVFNSLRGAAQTITGSVMTIQDRNLKLTQCLARFPSRANWSMRLKPRPWANES